MEPIKLAFLKVKQDIFSLETEITKIKLDLKEINNSIQEIRSLLTALLPESIPTDNPTLRHITPTYNRYPTDNPTLPKEVKGLKSPNLTISIGNEGVPTDRQTNRQTNQQTQKDPVLTSFEDYSGFSEAQRSNIDLNIRKASEILNSLDHLKKEIRLKFKQLTSQEMLVFSTVYQLEEKNPQNTTYKNLAAHLNLSESSARDYIQKIIKKGISIRKNKINNKLIVLSISPELKKIASLSTILQLREL